MTVLRKIRLLLLLTALAVGQIFSQAAPANNQKYKVTESVETLKIGKTDIRLVTHKTTKNAPIYFRPHENEATSSLAVRTILPRYGGTFIELKSKGERFVKFELGNKSYTFDPNRIFTRQGIEKTLGNPEPEARQEVEKFVERLFAKHLTDRNLLVAVHNNTDGGGLSMETYKKASKSEIAEIFINPARDIDDFFFVTDAEHFKFLKEKEFNVVLQNNETAEDDGSLSIYSGKRGISYINVESQHGHLQEQIEMLEVLQELFER